MDESYVLFLLSVVAIILIVVLVFKHGLINEKFEDENEINYCFENEVDDKESDTDVNDSDNEEGVFKHRVSYDDLDTASEETKCPRTRYVRRVGYTKSRHKTTRFR